MSFALPISQSCFLTSSDYPIVNLHIWSPIHDASLNYVSCSNFCLYTRNNIGYIGYIIRAIFHWTKQIDTSPKFYSYFSVTKSQPGQPEISRSTTKLLKICTNNEIKLDAISIVRSGIRTHAYESRLRPERSALDHSAILTYQFCSYSLYNY